MSEIKEKNAPYPVINALECKSCGRCVFDCPKGVLKIGTVLNARGYAPVVYAGTGCIGCANCYYTCPEPLAIEVHIPAKTKTEA
ncbi:ferredoxin family protein [Methanolapillus ohkumae]|uniref:Ferredoxin-type protein NapF n=1 Tax=Methanolapillus ohkumae TaxID=3028298 RepID=A0AA96ZVC5_9EURY|nr:Ferredoxin-type protein NapF [Methanosarcinaceae archaeon Am2]